MTFMDAMNTVCRDLPEGWILQIELGKDEGGIELTTPDGDGFDPDNWQYEETFEQQLLAALAFARKAEVEG